MALIFDCEINFRPPHKYLIVYDLRCLEETLDLLLCHHLFFHMLLRSRLIETLQYPTHLVKLGSIY
jgi:hypothetical protein